MVKMPDALEHDVGEIGFGTGNEGANKTQSAPNNLQQCVHSPLDYPQRAAMQRRMRIVAEKSRVELWRNQCSLSRDMLQIALQMF